MINKTGCGKSTLRGWKSHADHIRDISNSPLGHLRKLSGPKYPAAIQAVMDELNRAIASDDVVRMVDLRKVAVAGEQLSNPGSTFKGSNGWWENVKAVLDLKLASLQGEKRKADKESADEYIASLSAFLQGLGLPLGCLFNADESHMQFRPEIKRAVVIRGNPPPDSPGCDKEGMTFMPCVNATGKKLMK